MSYSDDWNDGGEPVDLGEASVEHATDDAVLVVCEDSFGWAPTWIPKSVLHDDSEVYDNTPSACGPGQLIVKQWWAEKNEVA